jgi:hypothetical protein
MTGPGGGQGAHIGRPHLAAMRHVHNRVDESTMGAPWSPQLA